MPIKNEKREVVLFLASHKDITTSKMAEMSLSDECDSGKDDEEVEQTQNFVYFLSLRWKKTFFFLLIMTVC